MISIGNRAPDNGGECSALVSFVPPPVIKAAIVSVISSTHSVHIGLHYGVACGIIALIAAAAILIRSVARLDPATKSAGSPTNELIRHTLFALILANLFSFDPTWTLIIIFLSNTITMFVPYPMPYLIRSMTKSATAISLVNVSLILAWLVPYTAPVIATGFIFSYLYSLIKIIIDRKK